MTTQQHEQKLADGQEVAPGAGHDFTTIARAGRQLQEACHGASSRAGWWTMPVGDFIDSLDLRAVVRGEHDAMPILKRLGKALVAEKLCLTHSEVSEGMEGHRKGKMDDHLAHRPMLEVELADAVIRIADLAGALNLDLGGAIAEKMAYNAQRPDHKPEARAAAGGKAY
jgi:NTP pyrophosphatase (non-canonical NTP hydrolase)